MFRETLSSRTLGMLIGLVQLQQPRGDDHEIDSEQRREESGARSVFEVVPERRGGREHKCRSRPIAQSNATRIPFEPGQPRRVNDYEQRRICTAARIEHFEPHVCRVFDLLLAVGFRFREAVEQQARRILRRGKRPSLVIAGSARINRLCEHNVLPGSQDFRPVRGLTNWIVEFQRDHDSDARARAARQKPLKELRSTTARRRFPSAGPAPLCCRQPRGSKRRASPCAGPGEG